MLGACRTHARAGEERYGEGKAQARPVWCFLTRGVVVRYVRAANVGDSCFMVVRRGRVLFRSPAQQHEFNFPYQLGGEGSDRPSDAQCFMVRTAPSSCGVYSVRKQWKMVFALPCIHSPSSQARNERPKNQSPPHQNPRSRHHASKVTVC